jgi:hypothetical protein
VLIYRYLARRGSSDAHAEALPCLPAIAGELALGGSGDQAGRRLDRVDDGLVGDAAGGLAFWPHGRRASMGAAGGGRCREPGCHVAVAEPTLVGRVIAAWPSFALTAPFELLTRQVRRGAAREGAENQQLPESAPSRAVSGPGWQR